MFSVKIIIEYLLQISHYYHIFYYLFIFFGMSLYIYNDIQTLFRNIKNERTKRKRVDILIRILFVMFP